VALQRVAAASADLADDLTRKARREQQRLQQGLVLQQVGRCCAVLLRQRRLGAVLTAAPMAARLQHRAVLGHMLKGGWFEPRLGRCLRQNLDLKQAGGWGEQSNGILTAALNAPRQARGW
jgi:hypothetical protein